MAPAAALYTISPSADSTVAIEISKTGLMRGKKRTLFFEGFRGELNYVASEPEASRIEMVIDAASVICRDKWLSAKRQQLVTTYAREALSAYRNPEITFASRRIAAKPLRGFVVEGVLALAGAARQIKVNVVLSPVKYDRFQIDGDSTFRLSDFGVKLPSSLFGLIGTKDEALMRLLLWAVPLPA